MGDDSMDRYTHTRTDRGHMLMMKSHHRKFTKSAVKLTTERQRIENWREAHSALNDSARHLNSAGICRQSCSFIVAVRGVPPYKHIDNSSLESWLKRPAPSGRSWRVSRCDTLVLTAATGFLYEGFIILLALPTRAAVSGGGGLSVSTALIGDWQQCIYCCH